MPAEENRRPRPLRSMLARGAVLLAALLVLFVAAFLTWAFTPYRADDTALAALESDEQVRVLESREGILFEPLGPRSGAGLVLYPGGRVEARAYAPLARRIAEEGHFVVIVPMPANLAVFGIERAGRPIAARQDVVGWAVGGHSLGGAMAAEYATREPERVEGLVLLAAYPGGSTDLSSAGIPVLTLHATEDGLVDIADINGARRRLPPGSQVLAITGGNHAGFGSYGGQRGDGESMLPPGAQVEIAARSVSLMLDRMARDLPAAP